MLFSLITILWLKDNLLQGSCRVLVCYVYMYVLIISEVKRIFLVTMSTGEKSRVFHSIDSVLKLIF